MRVCALALVAVLVLGACSSGDDATLVQDGIEARQIDGVWVFFHEPDAGMDALHSGTPEVVDGCLVVDGAVVIWHTEADGAAEAALAAALTGEEPQLLIGGGGISTTEGAEPRQLPRIVTGRCVVDTVWFGTP